MAYVLPLHEAVEGEVGPVLLEVLLVEHPLVLHHVHFMGERAENTALLQIFVPLAFEDEHVLLIELALEDWILFDLLNYFIEDFSVYFLSKF